MKLFRQKVLAFAVPSLLGLTFLLGSSIVALTVEAKLAFAPNVPPPVNRETTTVKVEMEVIETVGTLADESKYKFWTFNGTIPGPMVRIKEGDTVEFKVDYPGTYILVDHSIFRAIDKGAVGLLNVTGKEDSTVFSAKP